MGTTPACVVKRFTDRIDNRILRTYIDVSSRREALQCTPQHHVFEVLGVGNERH